MTFGVQLLSRSMDLDEAAVQRFFEHGDIWESPREPFYVRALVGLGAFVTALWVLAFAYELASRLTEAELGKPFSTLLGFSMFVAGLALCRGKAYRPFSRPLGVSICVVGMALAASCLSYWLHARWLEIPVTWLLLAVIAVTSRSVILQALASAMAARFVIGLSLDEVPYFLLYTSVATAVGAILLIRPLRLETRPVASVLLVMGPLGMMLTGYDPPPSDVWLVDVGAWILQVGILLWLCAFLWTQSDDVVSRSWVAVFAAVAIFLVLVLPPGGGGALVVLTVAYVLGSRLLAALGGVMQVYFLIAYYHRLKGDLLVKSMIVSAVGLILLALWSAFRFTARAKARL